ncbi:DUF3164 family protein [Flammeovirga sp. OC4]|uniref:DUF3164 family protein n=1 Tax=Flammeovirga sp. OC4 TaxID=1382345 RepID=UPI0005C46EE2|nr:DUF3164 family protein [Flammeovirga sp. OC4]
MKGISVSEMTSEQIEQLEKELEQRKKKEAAAKTRAKKSWENRRDGFVGKSCQMALVLSDGDNGTIDYVSSTLSTIKSGGLKGFKSWAFEQADMLQEELLDLYQGNNKSLNNYFLKTTDEKYKVEVKTQIKPVYDETFELGIEKIREWLSSTVKKAHKNVTMIVERLLSKNKDGQYNSTKILDLLSMKKEIKAPLFSEGCDLIMESVKKGETTRYIRFYKANQDGKFIHISIQFSAL